MKATDTRALADSTYDFDAMRNAIDAKIKQAATQGLYSINLKGSELHPLLVKDYLALGYHLTKQRLDIESLIIVSYTISWKHE